MEPSVTQEISGWGRHPVHEGHLYRPEKAREVARLLEQGHEPSFISRGLGRSYGDAALNRDAGVILHERLDRLLGFDAETGVLHAEAGVSMAEIIETFLPRGWFLPVTPGTQHVTLGGAIAADVHGKNHHVDGSIGAHVVELELATPGQGVLTCSPEQAPEAFWATVGGMGLTGAILSAKLQLRPVASAFVRMDRERAPGLEAALDAFGREDAGTTYSMAWIDCLARGKRMGRSVIMRGEHAEPEELLRRSGDPLALPERSGPSVPFTLPGFVLNRWSVRAFNAAYYRLHGPKHDEVVPLDDFFYPLDAIHHWNRIYGRRGFVQYQCVLPEERGREGMRELVETLAEAGAGSFLAVLKQMGPAGDGLLSFPQQGPTLALDLPMGPGVVELCHRLDEQVIDHGGRVYLAKDATLTPEAFRAMYPQAEGFLDVKAKLDPDHVLSSSLARRVGLLEGDA